MVFEPSPTGRTSGDDHIVIILLFSCRRRFSARRRCRLDDFLMREAVFLLKYASRMPVSAHRADDSTMRRPAIACKNGRHTCMSERFHVADTTIQSAVAAGHERHASSHCRQARCRTAMACRTVTPSTIAGCEGGLSSCRPRRCRPIKS